ncbi:TonB-dependent receptor [Alloacidobacterium dinghuense]|uniref:TonB-dependent receptor n=1 Tax=Alloacidobacterium dinghuense TaxID=2763107 RepID=A0A7G8BC74_9BACT|nr:carboxypeptidase regulatory-like domain-containing protein [Alloacidobacterium dinghuense]QNI30144.1 TonB-dependent receptor [Alloacidobacterium dinghuense]
MARYSCLFVVFLALAGLPGACFGQGLATLSGTVTDSTGAVIGSAAITVSQIGTGTTTVVKTNDSGVYLFPSLPPAGYSLGVVATGFKDYQQKGIVLQADQSLTVNVVLQVGQASQTVTVSANAVQVDTTTGTLSQVIDRTRVNDLPLNGRNAAQLTELVAGVVLGPVDNADQGVTKTFPAAVTVSVNGARTADTSYMFDGGNNIDEYTNVNQPFPFPDALQEFSVQTSNYNAEYGQNAGGVVNIVSRSGTEAYHGNLFEYVRNGVFNARNYFASTVDPLKRNQFGGTFGGPVSIPPLFHSKHTFFFVGYQKTIIRDQQGGVNAFIPTQANLAGDFSAMLSASNPDNPLGKAVQITNPHTGAPYPNNFIDPSTFDPASVALMKDLPSIGGSGSVFYQNPLAQNFDEILVRGDQDFRSKDHITLHYYQNDFSNAGVLNSSNLLTYASHSNIRVQSALASETHVFTPNILNSLIVNYSREVSERGPLSNSPSVADFGVNIYQPAQKAIVGIAATGFFTFGDSAFAEFQRNNYILADDFHWVKGNHNLAFGVHAEISKVDLNNEFNEPGTFAFNSNNTNYALASFLLGYLYTFNQGAGQYYNARNQFYGFYAQDSWHLTRRFTLNYGIRYEPFLPWSELFHRVEQFNPDAYAAGRTSTVYTNAPPGLLFPGDTGVPEQGVRSSFKNFMPRVGFAWDVMGNGKLSLRGGAGMFYDTRQPAIMNSIPSEISPFSLSVSLTNPVGPFSNPYEGINNPFPAPVPPPKNVVFPTPVQANTFDPSGDFQVPVTYAWNVTLEQQVTNNMTTRLAYVGAHASHLFVDDQLNPATYIPGSKLSTDQRRYFAGYTNIGEASMSGNSAYNSLQASIQEKVAAGFSILANYTFSKSMDTLPYLTGNTTPSNGPGNPYAYSIYMPNYKALDIGPSDFDRQNVFSASYVWQFPRLSEGNSIMRAIVNGWRSTGIFQIQSGAPLTITAGSDISQTGLLQDRAQWNGRQPYGAGACKASAVCKNYFDPSVFALPATGNFGNVTKGAFRGPGYFDWDAGLVRSFPLKGDGNFEFRAEYFNLLNHTNLNSPVTAVGSGGFGSITGANTPRIAQLSAKINF